VEYSRAEIKAGILIVVALVILGVMIYLVSNIGEMITVKKPLIVRFSQVGGINKGAPVRYAGVKVGHVVDIRTYVEPGKSHVDLICRIHKDLTITKNDLAIIGTQLTGDVWVDISPGEGEPLAEGEPLIGKPGYTPIEIQAKLVRTIKGLEEFITEERPRISEAISDIQKTAKSLSETSRKMKEYVQNDLKAILASAGETVEKAKTILEESEEPLKGTLQNLEASSEQAKEIVSGNRQKIEGVIESLQKTSENIKRASETFDRVASRALSVIESNRADIRQTVLHLRDIAANFKMASEDLRRNPWKLTYRPSKRERKDLETYELAVEVSRSASEVDSALRKIEAIAESSELKKEEKPENLAKALEELQGILEGLKKSEQALYKRLGE